MTTNLLANTSSPNFIIDENAIRINIPEVKFNRPVIVRLSGSIQAMQKINLTLIRVAGRVECPDCPDFGKEIPDPHYTSQGLSLDSSQLHLLDAGEYYLTGTRGNNEGLFNPCDPVIIDATFEKS